MPGGRKAKMIDPRARARALALVYVRIQMRTVVDAVKAWDLCGRPACRHARACRTPDVACFDEHSDEINERMTQWVEWSRFEGPYDDEKLDSIAAELREAGAPI